MPSVEVVYGCPACRDFNVFGIDDKGCCYLYMDYCKNHPECKMKEFINSCYKKDVSKEYILNKIKETFKYENKNT